MTDLLEEEITGVKKLKIMAVDDEKSSLLLLKKKLEKNIEGVTIIDRETPLYVFVEIATQRPQVLIIDWYYHGFDCTQHPELLPRLADYQGLICFYSNEDLSVLHKKISFCLGYIPKNFKIFSKQNYNGMLHEIIDYIANNF